MGQIQRHPARASQPALSVYLQELGPDLVGILLSLATPTYFHLKWVPLLAVQPLPPLFSTMLSINPQVSLVVYMVTFLTGLPPNLLAFCVFVVKARRRLLPADVLLLNLTVSDLLLLAFLPIRIAEASWDMKWRMPDFLCPFFSFLFFSSIYITILSLMGVSIDCYLSVAFPLRYKARCRPAYAMAAAILFWLAAFSHCSIVIMVLYQGMTNDTASNPTRCYATFTDQQLALLLPVRLEIFIVLFCLPFCITAFCYARFISIIHSLPLVSTGRKHRAIGLMVATFLIFVICVAPFSFSHLVGYMQQKSPDWRDYAVLLSTFNSSFDPIIFYFSSSSFQKICLQAAWEKLRLGWVCAGVWLESPENEATEDSQMVQ
ncbi:free fatty acid receptor 3-like [Carettochelys insculpta]|uniref:free fatty acid receptor 3-like n=1 Tax=Carettochelys insculpta TaxID=44489 RepID=UPI003EC09C2A